MKYGITRNRLFEQQLRTDLRARTEFTTEWAQRVYRKYRPGTQEVFYGMNARNYLAGAITAGVLERIERGRYRFVPRPVSAKN